MYTVFLVKHSRSNELLLWVARKFARAQKSEALKMATKAVAKESKSTAHIEIEIYLQEWVLTPLLRTAL
ncbi:hypothetical protein [Pseudomonas sp. PDM31]|uniref:hypothetical protein n=1 Tax=Pseudomonas sp. PDM31 TaxID=2854778 RepID=UPI001C4390B2|nr:hypothetical protein [Pseudomonas sp. PDM31]MBV7478358.1 hypothetical protein [Pseudomonas sp. PDM31]